MFFYESWLENRMRARVRWLWRKCVVCLRVLIFTAVRWYKPHDLSNDTVYLSLGVDASAEDEKPSTVKNSTPASTAGIPIQFGSSNLTSPEPVVETNKLARLPNAGVTMGSNVELELQQKPDQ